MHPEEFDRMFLRRGARTRAEEAAGLRRARRLAGRAAVHLLVPLLSTVVWILLMYFSVRGLERAFNR